MSEILYGIDVSEYRHPADIAALKAIEKTVPLSKIGEALEEYERSYQDEIVYMGTYVRLTESNAPRIFKIFKKTQEVLDCCVDADLYVCRNFSYRMSVGGIDKPIIKIPDTIIRNFDDTHLSFLFGQMLTMINGRMLKLFALTRNTGKVADLLPLIGNAIEVPLGQWKRKAQLTIDRGGLLACQDFSTAMQYLTLLSGASIRDLETIDISARVRQISDDKCNEKGAAATWGKASQTIFSDRNAWANERYIEMYNWYESGEYEKIISRHI